MILSYLLRAILKITIIENFHDLSIREQAEIKAGIQDAKDGKIFYQWDWRK